MRNGKPARDSDVTESSMAPKPRLKSGRAPSRAVRIVDCPLRGRLSPIAAVGRGWQLLGALLLLASLAAPPRLAAQTSTNLLITEFMASNGRTLVDEDGDYSDWVEIHNPGSLPVNLFNWCLTDSAADLAKWRFPATNLPPGGFLLVFASEKDRRIAGAPLHTNFKLSAGGEFLALVAPNASNVVSAFQPVYPPQAQDVSFGLGRFSVETVLVETGAVGRVLIPADGALGTSWTDPAFNDQGWSNAIAGIGFQFVTTTNNYRPLIRTDLLSRMFRTNATAYLRLPFVVADPALVDRLTLEMKYDDGYVAYLNGVEVSSDRAPDAPQWNSSSTSDRPDAAALTAASVSLTEVRGLLQAGTNVLAFQGLPRHHSHEHSALLPPPDAGNGEQFWERRPRADPVRPRAQPGAAAGRRRRDRDLPGERQLHRRHQRAPALPGDVFQRGDGADGRRRGAWRWRGRRRRLRSNHPRRRRGAGPDAAVVHHGPGRRGPAFPLAGLRGSARLAAV